MSIESDLQTIRSTITAIANNNTALSTAIASKDLNTLKDEIIATTTSNTASQIALAIDGIVTFTPDE